MLGEHLDSGHPDSALQPVEQASGVNLNVFVDPQSADEAAGQLRLDHKDLVGRDPHGPESELHPFLMQRLELLIFIGVSRHPERAIQAIAGAAPTDRFDLGDVFGIAAQTVQLEREDVVVLANRQRGRAKQARRHPTGMLARLVALDEDHLVSAP